MQLISCLAEYVGGDVLSSRVHNEDLDTPFAHWKAFNAGGFVAA